MAASLLEHGEADRALGLLPDAYRMLGTDYGGRTRSPNRAYGGRRGGRAAAPASFQDNRRAGPAGTAERGPRPAEAADAYRPPDEQPAAGEGDLRARAPCR